MLSLIFSVSRSHSPIASLPLPNVIPRQAAKSGYGQHIQTLMPDKAAEFFKVGTLRFSRLDIFVMLIDHQIVFVTEQWYGAAVTCVKISALLSYHRIFPSHSFRKWLIALGVISIVWEIVLSFDFDFSIRTGCKSLE